MRWGVEGGVNVSHAFDTEKTKAGFNIGAVGEYSFSSHWFMDASLKLSSQPCGIDVRGSSDDQKFWLKADYTPYYLTLRLPGRTATSGSGTGALSISTSDTVLSDTPSSATSNFLVRKPIYDTTTVSDAAIAP